MTAKQLRTLVVEACKHFGATQRPCSVMQTPYSRESTKGAEKEWLKAPEGVGFKQLVTSLNHFSPNFKLGEVEESYGTLESFGDGFSIQLQPSGLLFIAVWKGKSRGLEYECGIDC